MKRKVTRIVDRHKFTFVIFHRDHSPLGTIYYRPSETAKRMLARTVMSMRERGDLACYNTAPNIYCYDPVCGESDETS